MPSIDVSDDTAVDLDDADRAVLAARIRDARAGVRDIAAETGIVANRVDERLGRLEDADVIRGYTARVDYDKLGYDVTALVRITATDDDVLKRLSEDPRFVAIYAVTGPEDAVAIAKFRNTDEMNATVTELLTDDDVTALQATVAMDVLREFEPFTPEAP